MVDLVEIETIGYKAYLAGMEKWENPFVDERERDAWLDGWMNAAFDSWINIASDSGV